MTKKNTDKRHIIHSLLIISGCIITGWLYLYAARIIHANTANKHWANERYHARAGNIINQHLRDSCILLLQTGDLVVRRGDDMTSYMLAQMNETDKTYSHCGLAVIENGKTYIYHTIGGEDNPGATMKRENAATWFSPANNLAFAIYRYNLGDSCLCLLQEQLTQYYNLPVKFDMNFDLATDHELYCSEMVYKAITRATANTCRIPTTKKYHHIYVGIDNLYLHTGAKQVCQVQFK